MQTFTQTQFLRCSLSTAWAFFSNPANLQRITLPDMKFEVLSELPPKVYAGQIISYRVRPLFSIPVTWVTEITQVKELEFFVDEQRVGPFRFWHHQHHFEEKDGGILMTDIVNYELPLAPLSMPLNSFIRARLQKIFNYRREVVEKFLAQAQRNSL